MRSLSNHNTENAIALKLNTGNAIAHQPKHRKSDRTSTTTSEKRSHPQPNTGNAIAYQPQHRKAIALHKPQHPKSHCFHI
ncbi:hypothetical protein [Anabaena azotica]|uniref:hypothetical protein n=1 Tax=Anabaena azotica TaxID=197653 RepID=UPI0039A59E72